MSETSRSKANPARQGGATGGGLQSHSEPLATDSSLTSGRSPRQSPDRVSAGNNIEALATESSGRSGGMMGEG